MTGVAKANQKLCTTRLGRRASGGADLSASMFVVFVIDIHDAEEYLQRKFGERKSAA